MFRLSPALIAARLKGVLDAANAGAGNAAFRFYATPRPSVLGGHTDAPQAEVQLRADTSVPYGRVVQIMGWSHVAGLTRIGFVTELVQKAGGN